MYNGQNVVKHGDKDEDNSPKNVNNELFEIELIIICIKMDLVLNNLQRLICHKNQPINQPTNHLGIQLAPK